MSRPDDAVSVLYEDQFFQQLDMLVRRLRRAHGGAAPLTLVPSPVQGYGNFGKRVGEELRKPSMATRRPPELVIAIADADRAREFVPGIAGPPTQSSAQASWLADVEARWKAKLVKDAELREAESSRLEVILLRWSQESILIACPRALAPADEDEQGKRLEAFLQTCVPNPLTALAEQFLSFSKPQTCVEKAFKAMGKSFKKNREGVDIARRIAADLACCEAVFERVPEIRRLVELLGNHVCARLRRQVLEACERHQIEVTPERHAQLRSTQGEVSLYALLAGLEAEQSWPA